jgi:hypothetical protein
MSKPKRTKRAPKKPRTPPIDVQALAARGAAVDGALAEAHARLGRLEARMVRLEVQVNPPRQLPRREPFLVCNIVDCPSGNHSMPTSPCPVSNCPRKAR